jgi:Integral peroxisomal membrane peroxin
MPASKQEAKSTILAQFAPGHQPVGTTPRTPDTNTINLLDSTPPQIVRALAQAEPLIRGLNTLLGVMTWTSGQDWLSFLFVVGWWVMCLYGSWIIKFIGNFVPVLVIAGLYGLHQACNTPEE